MTRTDLVADDAEQVAETLERLTRAIEAAQVAEARADARTSAADSHMMAADAHMLEANTRITRAAVDQAAADEQTKEADRQTEYAMDDADRYQRALYHYRQLVRHRIANPLQIIKGMAHILLHQRGLGAQKRREMLLLIEEQADLLERLSLFSTELENDVEEGLHPEPFE